MVKSKEQLNTPVYKAFQVGRTLIFITYNKESADQKEKSPESAFITQNMNKAYINLLSEADMNIAEKPSDKEQCANIPPSLHQPSKPDGSGLPQ